MPIDMALAKLRGFKRQLDGAQSMSQGSINNLVRNTLRAIVTCHEEMTMGGTSQREVRRLFDEIIEKASDSRLPRSVQDIVFALDNEMEAQDMLKSYDRIYQGGGDRSLLSSRLRAAPRKGFGRSGQAPSLFGDASPDRPKVSRFAGDVRSDNDNDNLFASPFDRVRGNGMRVRLDDGDDRLSAPVPRSPFGSSRRSLFDEDDAQHAPPTSRFRENSPFADGSFNEPERNAPIPEPKVEVSDKDYMLGLKSNLKIDHDNAGDREKFALYFSLIDRIHKVEKIEARKDNPLFSTIVKYAQHDPEMAVELTHKLEGKLAPEDEATAYKVLRACYEQNFREIAKFFFPKP